MGKRRRRHRDPQRLIVVIGVAVLAIVVAGFGVFVVNKINQPDRSAAEMQRETERIATEAAAQNAQFEQERIDKQNAAKAQIVFPADRPYTVAFIGDSVTAGSYATTVEATWPNVLAAKLTETGPVEVAMLAEPGRRSSDALTLDIPPADLTLVMLGNNDAMAEAGVEGFQQTYPALLAKVRASSPTGALICLSPWFAASWKPGYHSTVKEACEAAGGEYVDISATHQPRNRAQVGDPSYAGTATDDGHPNDAGHKAIADKVLSQMFITAPGQ
ncbi:SGNH/GDSL hydrolase family protein [Microbacterium sp. QXD-8]|uniref:SGNH/GDSL hydrolase family protein n=1 Tax=Microbacterium psychrotolerans TaxID=3068321 RepID=A0ABU0YYG8_9MICO|nr:SGNH/GDSL hydrolase family protein [Microbacterium sp. QXD-8]MDQ7877384.1 SGNH/GDSL hydrolase family protein [Microbacterium sp. QXD-8]